jgi:1,4-dihydroxy-2-naphthoate octaprenyltransferase
MVTASQAGPRKKSVSLRSWFLECRPHYLLLPVVLVMVGTTAAWYEGAFNAPYMVLALIGLVLCHMSVNILNDYLDFKSGVDLKTVKSPFNGGSGLLPAGVLTPSQALVYGAACLALATPIGIFFVTVTGWQLLPLLVAGALCILFYTSFILKTDFPEWSPGVGLGVLPVLGAYYVQSGHYSLAALIASVPSGLLVLNLLLLNEFPDREADLIGHKKTLPITLGKKKAAIVYSAFTALVYLWVIGAVTAGFMPHFTLLALATLPLAYRAIRGSFGYDDRGKILPAMADNVLVVLITQAMIGLGYILAHLTQSSIQAPGF